ncbi:MAG: hypothetical protein WBE34_04845 [Candidatus Nitrosopolaris sp.]
MRSTRQIHPRNKRSRLSGQIAIYSLGVKLEQMVEQIMKNKGFSTERRIKLRGKSGATHEID